MELVLKKKEPEKVKNDVFGNLLKEVTRNLLRNVWEFADRRGNAAYAYIDFEDKAVDTFISFEGNIYSPLELHLLRGKGFDPLPSRRDAFLIYLQESVNELDAIWEEHGKLKPSVVQLGITDDYTVERMALEYSFGGRRPLEVRVTDFRNAVTSSQWPSSVMDFKL